MKVLEEKFLPDGTVDYVIELSDEERIEIKAAKGWKRLTNKRVQQWFLESMENTIEKDFSEG